MQVKPSQANSIQYNSMQLNATQCNMILSVKLMANQSKCSSWSSWINNKMQLNPLKVSIEKENFFYKKFSINRIVNQIKAYDYYQN